MKKFVHLHVHTHYSLLDGLPQIDELLSYAKIQGMEAVALTDHGVLYGAIEFYQKAKDLGVKPIIGVEAYVARHGRNKKRAKTDTHPYHLILLARNYQGYQNLIELISRAHLEGYYYKPRIDYEILEKFSAGLIALSACIEGHIPQLILNNQITEAEKAALKMERLLGHGNFFLELQHHPSIPKQAVVNEGLKSLSRKLNIPLVATNDAHYLRRGDAPIQDILMCIQMRKLVSDTDRLSMLDEDFSLRGSEEMFAAFADVPEAITNTVEIARKCNVEIELGKIRLPYFSVPDAKDPDDYLKELCLAGILKRYPQEKNQDEIAERLEYELEVIKKTGYATYFLIVQDFVNYAKNRGIVVGPGRGSAAGSIVAYLTNITDIDPLKYELLFERFLNPERVSMPDIDLDFADTRRDEVITYVAEKYGHDHVAQIITFGTIAARAGVRDVGRVLGYPYDYCDKVAKMIPMFSTLAEALKKVAELKDLYDKDPAAKKLLDAAQKLEGVARHASTHACGVVITKRKLTHYLPLQISTQDEESIVTQYSWQIVDVLGLLKMDFLGLKNLTIIQNTLFVIEKTLQKKINISDLPLDDLKAFEILQKGQTTGVFQLESAGMKRYLKQLKPTKFEDIIAMVSLYRPGPMEWIPDFIKGKHGLKQINYIHPILKPILEKTYGVAVYQEQVMQIAQELAGFSLGEADLLRKAMGKKIKELLLEQKQKFLLGCKKNNVPEEIAAQVFDFIEPFAGYGFNRSHAACYAMIGYRTAYLKAHFPVEFMAALLAADEGNSDRVAIEIAECEQMGIEVLPPDINESYADFTVVRSETGKKVIRFGLSAIKNVGDNVIKEIIQERGANGKFKNLDDFLGRVQSKDLNKKSLEAFAKSGALDKFAERNQILLSMERILIYTKNLSKAKSSGQKNLFGEIKNAKVTSPGIKLESVPPAKRREKLSWEKELLGLYVSEHPVDDYKDFLDASTNSLIEAAQFKSGAKVTCGGAVTSVKKIITRTREPMVFAKLEDRTGSMEVLAFPSMLKKNPDLWLEDKILLVEGKLNDRDGEMKILADQAFEINDELIAKWQKKKNPKPSPEKKENDSIEITVPKQASKNFFLTLKNLLAANPGEKKVFLKITGPAGEKKLATSLKINPGPETLLAIQKLVGKNSLS